MGSRKRPIESEYEAWDFHIDDWDHNYLFSTNRVREGDAPYDESRQFTLYCTVTYPDHQKGCVAILHFLPNRDMDAVLAGDVRAYGDLSSGVIGKLSTRKGDMSAFVSVPWKSSAYMLQLLSNGTFKYVQLHGRRIKRRGIEVSTIMFAKNDPET